MILMNDFRSEPEELVQQELKAMERVVRSGWYVLGNEVKEFERRWADRCGLRYAVGVGNGMDAIEIGLRALGIGEGDEVITTPMTAFASVLAILRAGAEPVLADIDPETALLDPDSVTKCISARTKGVLLVHLYGHVNNMERWQALCRSAGIHLLEDCAQAHGAVYKGQAAGSFGIWGSYSFYPTKNLGACGDGGAIVTDSFEIAEKAAALRNYGQTERFHHTFLGLNSRLDELQAAILSARLDWMDGFSERRREIATAYLKGIRNQSVQPLTEPLDRDYHSYHQFVVLCSERDRFACHLREHGIESLIHYPVPIHLQEPCFALRKDPRGLPHAENHGAQCLSIPCNPQLSDDNVRHIIESINEFV